METDLSDLTISKSNNYAKLIKGLVKEEIKSAQIIYIRYHPEGR
jgi:hypothetical protein